MNLRTFKISFVGILMAFASLFSIETYAATGTTASIVAVVNDEPISNHDIDMRIKLHLSNSKDLNARLKKKLSTKRTQKLWKKMIEEYQPQSQQEAKKLQGKLVNQLRREVRASMGGKLRKKVLKELISERIQLQQANKLGVALSDEDIDARLDQIAGRNKNKKTGKPLSRQEFSKSLNRMGIPLREFRSRMKAKGSWIRVVRRKFQFQVNIGDQEVDRLINTQSNDKNKLKTVYNIQRIRLSMSSTASESIKTKRFIEAEKLRQAVTSCDHLKKIVGRISGASLKLLGTKSADTFPHTMRAYLSHAKNGQLTPPTLTSSGVELYAVCDRKQRRIADKSKRKAVKEKLRQQEFEVLARRHLQDLRQEASIEYR